MKFLKLNKLNEDFFDDVEIGVDDEIENEEEYEFSIKFKPVCGSREVKFFVNMMTVNIHFLKEIRSES